MLLLFIRIHYRVVRGGFLCMSFIPTGDMPVVIVVLVLFLVSWVPAGKSFIVPDSENPHNGIDRSGLCLLLIIYYVI